MKHELLAPAGNIEAGYAALYYGADAVYLGLNKFSARAGADNFNFDELNEFTAYAHSLKRKVFVALNTILTEEEVKDLPEMFQAIAKAKVDALIIQDLGVFHLAKKLLPEVELHASTQMAIHNVEGAKFLQSLGFKRVVLARELSLPEIKEIATALPDLDLEVFVHGALCYSYSGQCMFSALEYGKSANRGRCVYPCRGLFEGMESCAKTHLFSMKDLALEEDVLKLPALSLKIEGRKKSPLYVAAVTNYYRHILDGKKKDLKEAEDIKQIFSRPWCHFHLNNNKDKNIVDENFVGHRGLLIGKIERIGKHKIGFKTAHTIARHDGIQIDVSGDEKPFGFGIKELSVNGKRQIEAQKGSYVELELPDMRPHLTIGEPIYLSSASEVKGKYAYAKPKSGEYKNLQALEVTVEITEAEVWAMSNETAVSVKGSFEVAKDATKVEYAVRKAFAKTGGTDFEIKNLHVHNLNGRFVPVSILNELRRKLLENIVPEQRIFELPEIKTQKITGKPSQINLFRVELGTSESQISDYENVWFELPQICRNTKKLAKVLDMLYQNGARKFVVENYYGFEMLKRYKDIQIGAGSFLYVMNHYATESLRNFGAVWGVPALESSPENMKVLAENSALKLVQTVRAYPPLFTSAVCIRRNDCKHCEGGTKTYKLVKDGRTFTAISKDCQVQVFDDKPYERELIDGMWGFIKETK